MIDLDENFLQVDARIWLTGGAIVLLVAIAHVALRW